MSRRVKQLVGRAFLALVVLVFADIIWHPLVVIAAVAFLLACAYVVLAARRHGTRKGVADALAIGAVALFALLGSTGGTEKTRSPGTSAMARRASDKRAGPVRHRSRPRATRRAQRTPRRTRRRHPHPAVAAAAALGVATKTSGCHARGLLPDPACTPGSVFATASVAQICTPGYSARARDVSEALKDQRYAAYRIASHTPEQWEMDHLVPLELGGDNSAANLWPQHGYGAKDELENTLHDQVCSHALSLRRAQEEIGRDWEIAARNNGIATPTPSPAATAPTPSTTSPPSIAAPTPSDDGIDKDCSDFSTQAEAQRYFESQGGSPTNNVDRLDANGDGIACNALP